MKKKPPTHFYIYFIPVLENIIVSQSLLFLKAYLLATAQLPLAQAIDM